MMTHAFFPGGNGLYDGIHATRMPTSGTVILGSNFGCVSKFINAQGKLLIEDERSNPTWKPLLENLTLAAIDVTECFFTNAWPLLHLGESNRGPVRQWLNDPALMASCLPFFEYTLTTMQPSLIVALGTGPAAFLSHIWPKDLSPWRAYSLRGLDDLPMATVRFEQRTMICVAVTHPSMRNARQRRPPYQHRKGEIRLLTEARTALDKT
ncbi:MAG TPA: uracil-DNA glycosylase family protein [Candidatus Angelobacter sp.]